MRLPEFFGVFVHLFLRNEEDSVEAVVGVAGRAFDADSARGANVKPSSVGPAPRSGREGGGNVGVRSEETLVGCRVQKRVQIRNLDSFGGCGLPRDRGGAVRWYNHIAG